MLSEEKIFEAVRGIKNGQYVSIEYRTEPTLKAAMRKEGYKVVKKCECVGRLGVNYENIGVVKDMRAGGKEKSEKVDNYYWIIENKIAGNSKTGKKYLRVTSGGKSKSNYQVWKDGVDVSDKVDYKDLIIPSYWSGGEQLVKNIKLENIERIGRYGTSESK